MPETRYKICPRCQTHAELTAPFCTNCGRKYSTHFGSPPPAPTEPMTQPMTQAYRPPRLSPNLPPAAAPQYVAAPSLTDGRGLPPDPNAYALKEYATQYRNLCMVILFGIFGIWAGPIGLGMIIYALIQQPALRRKVAELGIDPDAWARPMHADALKWFLYILGGIVGMLVLVGGCMALFQGGAR